MVVEVVVVGCDVMFLFVVCKGRVSYFGECSVGYFDLGVVLMVIFFDMFVDVLVGSVG